MKKYHLISLIALTSIALAGCEWDSSKYDNYVADGNVTVCPGRYIQQDKWNFNVCNLVRIGNLYCGPEGNGVNLIALNDDGSIYCVNNKYGEYKKCEMPEGTDVGHEILEKYPAEWKTCQDFRKNGLFEGISSTCNDESKKQGEKLKEKLEKISFIGNITFNEDTPEKYIEAQKNGICPSDYPVCHYENERIGCIALLECGDKKCDPRTQTCEQDKDGGFFCAEKVQDKCANKQCKIGQVCNGLTGECVDESKKCIPECDNTTQYCNTKTGECVDKINIIFDPCEELNLNCDYDTQYCKPKEESYECAPISFDPCAELNCTSSQYCAKIENAWRCVSNETCPQTCTTAAHNCLTEDLALVDPGNCGGCRAENEIYNCSTKYPSSIPACDNGQCIITGCFKGYYQVDNEGCFPYGDDRHCKKDLDCTDPSNFLDNSWTSARCEIKLNQSGGYNPANFEENKCVAASCKSGYHLYDGNCEADSLDNCGSHGRSCGTVDNSSSLSCDNGTCKPVCKPGFHEYLNPESNVIECEENSLNNCGSHANVCTASSIENADSVSCSTGLCLPDTCKAGYHAYSNTCEANDLQHCGSHENVCNLSDFEHATDIECDAGVCKAKTCVDGYDVMGTECEPKTCEQGSVKCRNGLIYTCNNNNEWDVDNAEPCVNNVSCKSITECGDCTNGSKKCNDGDNVPVICQEGVWVNRVCTIPEHNATLSCTGEGECAFECDLNYVKTSDGLGCEPFVCETNDHKCEEGKYKTCYYNKWSDGVACEAPANGIATCSIETGCGMECNSSSYSTQCGKTCVNVQNDMNNCGDCGVKCDVNNIPDSTAVACQNNQCVASRCRDDCKLVNGRCECKTEICIDGSIKSCTDNTDHIGVLSVCRNNQYVNENCPDENSCKGEVKPTLMCNSTETCCGECKNGTSSCTDSQLTECINGALITSACPNNFPCRSEQYCRICNDGEKSECTDSDRGGRYKLCVDGFFSQNELCENNVSCNSSTNTCGECRNGAQRCVSGADAYQRCINGVWGDAVNCLEGETCSGEGVCGSSLSVCPAGQANCGTSAAPECKDLSKDSSNCGACNYDCSEHVPDNASLATTACVNSVCQYQCSGTYVNCGSDTTSAGINCVDTQNDISNCGSCNHVCNSGESCIGGRCEACINRTCEMANCQMARLDSTCTCECNQCNNKYHLTSSGTCEPNNAGSCGSATQSNAVSCNEDISHNNFNVNCSNGTCVCRKSGGAPATLCDCTAHDYGFRCSEDPECHFQKDGNPITCTEATYPVSHP